MHKSALLRSSFVLALIPLFCLSTAYGIGKPASNAADATGSSADQIQKRSLNPSAASGVALEEAINPATYKLGPGDRLSFEVWGAFEMQYDLTVAPDGQIDIPTVGDCTVAGLELAKADSIVRVMAKAFYPRAECTLRLTGVRKMKVLVTGAVNSPGAYEVSAVDRLQTAINLAGGPLAVDREVSESEALAELKINPRTPKERRVIQQIREEKAQRPLASTRHVQLKHRDGSRGDVDLQMFFANGNSAFNPVLCDGDEIYLPLLDRETGVITLYGAVRSPGEFEFRQEDCVKTIVDLGGGFKADALLNDLSVIRFENDGRTQREIHVDLTKDPAGPALLPDDRIFVRRVPELRKKYNVSVRGEVVYPGTYAIEDDETKLSAVIALCGGLTDRANLSNARVVRQSLSSVEDPEFERLKSLSVAEMTEMEYEYYKIRSREEAPGVVVDFAKLFQDHDNSFDVALSDGDEIVIPTLNPTVKVAGQVNNPGLVKFVEGKNYEYYIGKAGGFSWNAREGKIRLIKAHSGTWIKPKTHTPIEIGDTIFVPEKQEIDWWVLSKDLLLAVSQIATVLIMVKSL